MRNPYISSDYNKRAAPTGRYLQALIAPRIGAHHVIQLDLDKHGRVDWQALPVWKDGPTVVYLDRSGHKCSGWAEYRIRGVLFRTRWDSDGSGNAPAVWIRLGGERYQVSSHYAPGYREGHPEPRGGGYKWSADGNTILDTRPPDAVQDYGEERRYDGTQLEWFTSRYYLMSHADGGYPYLFQQEGDPLCSRCATLAAFKGGKPVTVCIFHEGTVETCSDCSTRIRPFHVVKDEDEDEDEG